LILLQAVTVETFLLNHVFTIAGVLIILGASWYKLGGIKENREALAAHKNDDEAPHKPCREHSATLRSINAQLGDIRKTLSTIDDRVFSLYKNGKKPAQATQGDGD